MQLRPATPHAKIQQFEAVGKLGNLLQVYGLISCGPNRLAKSPSLSYQTVRMRLDPTLNLNY